MSGSKDLNPSSLPVAIELQASSPRPFFSFPRLFLKTSVPKNSPFETWMVSEETKEGDDQEEDIIVSEDVVIFTQDSDLVDDIEMGG